MKKNRKRIVLFGFWLLFVCSVGGCSNRTELEDRNFVMTLGVEAVGDKYRFTYQMPDMGASTGQPDKERGQGIITLDGESMAEIEETYASKSNKRLDYNHMKAVIFHEDLAKREGQMQAILRQFQEKSECSRNTYVYFSDTSPERLLHTVKVEEDLGSYLENLHRNKDAGRGKRKVTIGDYITCSNNQTESLTIPLISLKEEMVLQSGGGIVIGASLLKRIPEEEYQLLDLISGKGSGWQLAVDQSHRLRINHLLVSDRFAEEDGIPIYSINIAGRVDILSGEDWDIEEFNRILSDNLRRQFHNYSKIEMIDYLNLYRRCGVKNRMQWKKYKGEGEKYLKEVKFVVKCSLQ